jgi:hypothetical protein
MIIWIVVLIVGLAYTVIGLITLFKNPDVLHNKKSLLLIGIFLPLIFAYSYAETLIKDFHAHITLIDLGGLLILGIISGIFTACYFLTPKI